MVCLSASRAFLFTPKAFANFSPEVGAQRQPWVAIVKNESTLKALGMCKVNPFRVVRLIDDYS